MTNGDLVVRLINLTCNDAQEATDEIELRFNGSTIWSGKMKTGDKRDIGKKYPFAVTASIGLYEIDRTEEEHIGTHEVNKDDVKACEKSPDKSLPMIFKRDRGIPGDAKYTLKYCVYKRG